MISQTQNILAMWTPGPLELIVILVIAVLLFGRRLPEIARGIGKSLTEFKKGVREAQNEVTKAADIDEISKPADTTNQTSPPEPQDSGDKTGNEEAEDILRPR